LVRKKLTYKEVKNFIEVESNSGCKLINKTYENKNNLLKIQCVCKDIFYVSFANFKNKNKIRCNKCNGYTNWNYEILNNNIKDLGYTLISKEYKSIHSKIIVMDNYGYYYTTYYHHLKNKMSPKPFYINNSYTIQNIKLWCKLNNKPFELLSDEYKNSSLPLKWECLKNGCREIFEMNWSCIQSGQGCPFCHGSQVGVSNCLATKRPDLAKEWHPTKNGNLTPYDVTCGSNKKVWWQCSKYIKHEWEAHVNLRKRGNGCPYCSGFYTSEDYNLLFNNPILCEEWNYKKNKKNPEEYTPGSNQRVWWICKECSYEWIAQIANRNKYKGSGCPVCAKSKGELIIKQWLENNNINYQPQYTFDDLLSDLDNPLRFDFAILENYQRNDLKFLIEYDGEFHYKKYYERQNFEVVQYHDKLKNEYCKKHNIPLLRIPYWDFDNIEAILKVELDIRMMI
jgi:hypothetical protein